MSILTTARLLLKKYSTGDDPHPTRAEFNLMIDALENNSALFSEGFTDARPLAGKRGRFFWDKTVLRMFYDNGTLWYDLNPNGGGGAGAKVIPGATAVEGSSARSARADHTHTIDLATALIDGAMAKADKAKLDSSSSLATAQALAQRDGSGRLAVGTPSLSGHAATKAYVDGLVDGLDERMVETAYTAYTPVWTGFSGLGSSPVTAGEWSIIAPGTVRVSAYLEHHAGSGIGGAMTRLFFSLPFPVAATPIIQSGTGVHALDSGAGPHRRMIVEVGGGAVSADMWAWPEGTDQYQTLAGAGYAWGPYVQLHVDLIYKAVMPV